MSKEIEVDQNQKKKRVETLFKNNQIKNYDSSCYTYIDWETYFIKVHFILLDLLNLYGTINIQI